MCACVCVHVFGLLETFLLGVMFTSTLGWLLSRLKTAIALGLSLSLIVLNVMFSAFHCFPP